MTKPIRCDECGRFVDTSAKRTLVTPQSHFTSEEWETVCVSCQKKKRPKHPLAAVLADIYLGRK